MGTLPQSTRLFLGLSVLYAFLHDDFLILVLFKLDMVLLGLSRSPQIW